MGKPQDKSLDPKTQPDAPLRAFVGYGMKRAFNIVRADVDATLAPHKLRMVTFSALSLIGHQPGLRQSALAELMLMEPPNLVTLLDELERSDLVARKRSKSDRRVYELWLTKQGERVLAAANADVMEHDRRMTRALSSAERTAMIDALSRIERSREHGE